ncbi:hypothetical protein Ciccas_013844 [Cichlidogyrus casuarinus]|uniref:Serine-threonine/tyrosine-protein kinase catalytic domain-containing protein n=1 Tax=Cichlidogyrus casuarinus TaxID=1844966 RepID=A0ABD2PJJ0_9PLAT
MNLNFAQVINYVTNGKTLDIPIKCPDIIKVIMTECWHQGMNERISFVEILNKLETFVNQHFLSVSYYHNVYKPCDVQTTSSAD